MKMAAESRRRSCAFCRLCAKNAPNKNGEIANRPEKIRKKPGIVKILGFFLVRQKGLEPLTY